MMRCSPDTHDLLFCKLRNKAREFNGDNKQFSKDVEYERFVD